MTPNRHEASQQAGRPIESVEDALEIADQLRDSLEAVLLTLDADGMVLAGPVLGDALSGDVSCDL